LSLHGDIARLVLVSLRDGNIVLSGGRVLSVVHRWLSRIIAGLILHLACHNVGGRSIANIKIGGRNIAGSVEGDTHLAWVGVINGHIADIVAIGHLIVVCVLEDRSAILLTRLDRIQHPSPVAIGIIDLVEILTAWAHVSVVWVAGGVIDRANHVLGATASISTIAAIVAVVISVHPRDVAAISQVDGALADTIGVAANSCLIIGALNVAGVVGIVAWVASHHH